MSVHVTSSLAGGKREVKNNKTKNKTKTKRDEGEIGS
jgi:hypothetical protein